MTGKQAMFAALGLSLATTAAYGATATPIATIDPQWRLLGPFRGGWAEMIEGIPGQPDSFIFGAAGGGIWRSDNAGRTWASLFDHGPTAPIGAVAAAPSDGAVLYAGSGQPEPRYDVASGEGMFRSTDGGATWTGIGLERTRAIGRIRVDPRDAKTLLVAAVGDMFAANPERGVFRSTDGGASWSHTLAINADTGAVDLAADPADPNTVFAAAWQVRQYPWQSYFTPAGGPDSGVYKSTDDGVTWTRLTGAGWPRGPLGRISLAATRTASGLRVYAVVSDDKVGGLYRSDDGGASWARINDEQAATSYYASRVTVDPKDPDRVYLVGQSVRRCDHGGAACEIVKGAPGGDDYHFVWISPEHPDHMAVTSDQGAQVSVDGGRTWSTWYNQPTAQVYHLADDRRFPYHIYAGQQDSGTVSIASRSDYGAISLRDWTPVGGDERDFDIPDPDDPNIVYATGLGGGLNRFDARTGQSANIAPYLLRNYGQRQTTTDHHFVWVTPMAVSRAGPTTLYLGAEVVWASTDRGAHWSVISPDLTGKSAGAQRCDGDIALADAKTCGYGGIWTLTPSPRHAGELWVGTDDGLVQLTRDGGAHWSNITPPRIAEWAKIASIDVSASEDGAAYIAVDGQRLGDRDPHAWATHDYGATWTEISGDLPRGHFVSVVRADTERHGLIFAGTDTGVYASWDEGAHWRPLQGNLPTAWVRDLLIHDDDLVAGTQGRSIWVLGDLALLRQFAPGETPKTVRLFTPAAAVRARINSNHDTPAPIEEPAGQNPPDGVAIDYWLPANAKGPVTLDIFDDAGVRVSSLTSDASAPLIAGLYFHKAWLSPPAPLATSAGLHRVYWNLRWDRPKAITYDYSISTAAGTDTPITPQGPLALPGDYKLVLRLDGAEARTSVKLVQDPRSPARTEDLASSLALSKALSEDMALARRGYGETAMAHAALVAAAERLRSKAGDTALIAKVETLAKATIAPTAGPSFASLAETLASLETDLEGADLAPTQPQLDTRDLTRRRLDVRWTAWSALRDHELAAVNAELTRAGEAAVMIPAEDKLVIAPPDAGEDLP